VKLATLKDGTLVVVSRDLGRAAPAPVAATLQDALERWTTCEPELRALADRLESSSAENAIPFHPADAAAPLPRAPAFLDGSAFAAHGLRMIRALGLPEEHADDELPLMYQGASDDLLGAHDDVVVADEDDGIDFEGEIAVVVDDVPMRTPSANATEHIKLLLLVNDVSLRRYAPREMATGFGFVQAKPPSSFSPVAVTPDELGEAWRDARCHLPLRVEWNGEWFGNPNAGEMAFGFHQLIEHVTRTRRLRAGTIIGSGTVANEDRAAGSACIAERRAIELVEHGEPRTSFMRVGDRVRIEMLDAGGRSVFGAIDQRIVPLPGR
jgi:fumarylacetoacetate (FAA) hydrolase